jgi:hypothetical protein
VREGRNRRASKMIVEVGRIREHARAGMHFIAIVGSILRAAGAQRRMDDRIALALLKPRERIPHRICAI